MDEKKERQRTLYRGGASALEIRAIRNMVRQTTSLIATHGPIRECPGPNWAVDLKSRTIFWRPTSGHPPFRRLDKDELLGVIVHEASHLNYTGGWETPKDINTKLFHRFVNAVEDIRIERLACKEFPGFVPIRVWMNKQAHNEVKGIIEGMHPLDQVGMGYLVTEENFALTGKPRWNEFVNRTWPEVSRIANSRSTADLAKQLVPIYREIVRAVNANDEPEAENIPGSDAPGGMSPMGADEPTDNPIRSPLNRGEKRLQSLDDMTVIEMLEEMAGDASGYMAIRKLRMLVNLNMTAEAEGKRFAEMAVGSEAGVGDTAVSERKSDILWDDAKNRLRRDINALTRRLQATLKTNAMDDWQAGMKRGQLDMGVAYTSLSGNMAIYRTREEVGALDYTFGILIDTSSSQNHRGAHLLDATVLIAEAADRADLNLFLLPWSTRPWRMKRTHHKLADHKSQLGKTVRYPSGSTVEAYALVMAQEELRKIRSGNKVLITITDGITRLPGESEILIDEMTDEGVKCIAIAIRCDAAKHYRHTYRIEDVTELTRLLPRIINENMKKGVK